ncbi:MAG: hypothetical protein K2M31_01830 [Muribaculaceae bacterium]|nr:hypothetical protein [Muribaculaceae bacterium]
MKTTRRCNRVRKTLEYLRIISLATICLLSPLVGKAQEIIDSIAEIKIETPVKSPAPLKPTSTPVDIDREKPEQPYLHYYDKHGNALETPVRFLTELDTVVNVKAGPTYPTFNGVSVGINFFDGLMMIAGQQRASFDLHADCSIHNWFFPVVELGIGYADAHPEDNRCHYKSTPALYAKVGMNYNFLYKSNPDYQVYLGLRAGFSHFSYNIDSILAGSMYYQGETGPASVSGLNATEFYGQVVAGLKVKIYRNFSMGWSFRYAFNIRQRYSDELYPAWFVPGRGTGPISATFSAMLTFGARKQKPTDQP